MIVAGAGVGALWYCKPRNGQVHPLVTKPLLDWLIPVLIITAFAIGGSLVISGVVG